MLPRPSNAGRRSAPIPVGRLFAIGIEEKECP
jgi:hypothetical protein